MTRTVGGKCKSNTKHKQGLTESRLRRKDKLKRYHIAREYLMKATNVA